jgi:GTP cyclohydrolase II
MLIMEDLLATHNVSQAGLDLLKADGMLDRSTLSRAREEGLLQDMLKDLGMKGGDRMEIINLNALASLA